MRWLKLEPIIQSGVSQKEKNKYCIIMHIHGIQKDDTGEIIFRTAMETQIQRTDLQTQRAGRRKRVGCMKRVTWKFTLPYVEQIVNGNLLSDLGNSNWASVTFQRSGMGRKVQEGRIICILWQIQVLFGRNQHNFVKLLSFN